jgi:hypothetical protein
LTAHQVIYPPLLAAAALLTHAATAALCLDCWRRSVAQHVRAAVWW